MERNYSSFSTLVEKKRCRLFEIDLISGNRSSQILFKVKIKMKACNLPLELWDKSYNIQKLMWKKGLKALFIKIIFCLDELLLRFSKTDTKERWY